MRRQERVGTKYDSELDESLDANQRDIADELLTPHSTRLNEYIGSSKKIVSSVPAYEQCKLVAVSSGIGPTRSRRTARATWTRPLTRVSEVDDEQLRCR